MPLITNIARVPWRLAANFVLFQGAWFAGVLAPPLLAELAAALALACHLAFIALPREWRFILLATFIGACTDGVFAASGVFEFNAATTLLPSLAALPLLSAPLAALATPPLVFIPPLWLLLLWANFAAVLLHSLRWLGNYRALAFALGAIVGPATYLGGTAVSDKLHIAASPIVFILAHAPCWAILCAFLPQAAKKICRV